MADMKVTVAPIEVDRVDRRIPLAATVDGALMFLASRDARG